MVLVDMELMADFNQGLHLGEALQRCHTIDEEVSRGWRSQIAYDNLDGYAQLTRELKTPVQMGENFYGPRELYNALAERGGRLYYAGFDADWRCKRMVTGLGSRPRRAYHVHASLPGICSTPDARQRNRTLV